MNLTQFSRPTIVEAFSILDGSYSHSKIDRFLLKFELEEIAPKSLGDKRERVDALLHYLVNHTEEPGPFGSNLIFEMIELIIEDISLPPNRPDKLETNYPQLINSLKHDGCIIENDKLVTMLPDVIDLPEKEDELNSLLDKFQFNISKGHFNQAISAHTRGDWASANAQFRSFIESLFDSIAEKIHDNSTLPLSSHKRREFLAREIPQFFSTELNEWVIGNNGGFVQGFWKRLNPQGSHPGLSNEEDSTFRLHLVILTASHYMKRLDNMV